MKGKQIFGLMIMILGFATIIGGIVFLDIDGLVQNSIIDPVTDQGNIGDQDSPFVSAESLCPPRLEANANDLDCNQIIRNADGTNTYSDCGHYEFAVKECRECPKLNQPVPASCHFGCGTPCPEGANCYYPPNCATNGCGTSCSSYCNRPNAETGENEVYCCAEVTTCRDPTINYWEGWIQGCMGGFIRETWAAVIIGQEENLAQEELKFLSQCDPDYTGPIENGTGTEPVICDKECPNEFVLDYDLCECKVATPTIPPDDNPIPKPYRDPSQTPISIAVIVSGILITIGGVWLLASKKRR